MITRYGWVMVGLIFAMGCVSPSEHAAMKEQTTKQGAMLERLMRDRDQLAAENARLFEDLNRARTEKSSLDTQFQATSRANVVDESIAPDPKESSMRKQLLQSLSQGVEGVEYQDGRLVLQDVLMFKSGSSQISDQGRKVLRKLGQSLKKADTGVIQIIGYTDDTPIVKKKKSYPLGNRQLGAERALAVASVLEKDGGVAPDRILVSSWGQYGPGRKEKSPGAQRRVEIALSE